MNFIDFSRVAFTVIDQSSLDVKQSWIIKDENYQNKETLLLYSLVKCFKMIFPRFYESKKFPVNEYFLDWTTETNDFFHKAVMIKDKNNLYMFLPEEIVHIFHNDLTRSYIEVEPTYNVCNIIKSFRIPHNPYSNTPFSLADIKDIISQLILMGGIPNEWKKYPELYIFFQHFESIYRQANNLNNYFMTDFLSTFFKKKGLHFQEKFKKKTKSYYENLSVWKSKNNKGFDDAQFYLSILRPSHL